MTKDSFWKMMVVNLGECSDCPLCREELCKKYTVGTGDNEIAPCFNPKMLRKAYDEMEDNEK